MASRKSFLSKPSHYIFPATSETHLSTPTQEGIFELDEAELWSSSHSSMEAKKGLPSSGTRSVLKRASRNKVEGGGGRVAPASLPVNIPDWSKILKEDYKEHPKWESDDAQEEEEDLGDDKEKQGHHRGGIRVPPHEYLARTRGASQSVHEGIGRTLKGRDLRSVRNAIWKKVGFED
ncbi:Senescence regulator S40 [Spatholobus suberectus]|nr:Senescence regulator S40 [Spatholobus suberectus]